MSWEDWEDCEIAEEADFGTTNEELAQIAPKTEEIKTKSNKELKAEKQANKKEEVQFVDPTAGMTDEEKKIFIRKQQEEAELKTAEQMFSGVNDFKLLDTMDVQTDKDYQKFGKILGAKGFSLYKPKNQMYKLMIKECMRELVSELNSVDIKELCSFMEVLYNQKLGNEKDQQKKAKKSKKNAAMPAKTATFGGKQSERLEDQIGDDYYDDDYDNYDDEYDFM